MVREGGAVCAYDTSEQSKVAHTASSGRNIGILELGVLKPRPGDLHQSSVHLCERLEVLVSSQLVAVLTLTVMIFCGERLTSTSGTRVILRPELLMEVTSIS